MAFRWSNPFDSRVRLFLVLFGFLALFLLQYFVLKVQPYDAYPCRNYLIDGTLYSGQPMCPHGPVTYVLYALLRSPFLILLFNYVLYFIILVVIIHILRAEKMTWSFTVLLSSFLLFVVFLGEGQSPSIYATFFFFLGFYFFSYSRVRYRILASGLFFSLAIHSKMIALLYFVFFMILYVVMGLRKGRKVRHGVHSVLVILFIVLAITMLFQLFLPNLLAYTLLWHTNISGKAELLHVSDVLTPLRSLFDLPAHFLRAYPSFFNYTSFISAQSIFILLYAFFAFFIFLQRKHFATAFACFGFVFFYVILLYRYNFFAVRYFFPLFPFFVLAASFTYPKVHGWRQRTFSVLFILLAFTALMMFHRSWFTGTETFTTFEREVAGGLVFLPSNYRLLLDSEDDLRSAGFPLNYSLHDRYPEQLSKFGDADRDFLERFSYPELLEERWKNWRDLPYSNKTMVKEKIARGKYDVLSVSLLSNRDIPALLEEIYSVNLSNLTVIQHGAFNVSKDFYYRYAVLYPTIHQKCISCEHLGMIIFRNLTAALDFRDKLADYYVNRYEGICQRDEFVANEIVLPALFSNAVFILNAVCTSDSSYYRFATGSGILNSYKDLFILFFLLLFGFYFLPRFP